MLNYKVFERREDALIPSLYIQPVQVEGNCYICMQRNCVAQMVKCLPTMREIWVQSLDWEDPLEKEMATHSSTLAWKIPWMEEPSRL